MTGPRMGPILSLCRPLCFLFEGDLYFLGCFIIHQQFPFVLYFQGKARLGAVVHKKNATALAITAVKNVSYLALMGVVLASCCAARVSRAQRI